jgi:hypothetical protein
MMTSPHPRAGAAEHFQDDPVTRGARALIQQYGTDALAVALSRSARWEAASSPDAAATWRKIAEAIRQLEGLAEKSNA